MSFCLILKCYNLGDNKENLIYRQTLWSLALKIHFREFLMWRSDMTYAIDIRGTSRMQGEKKENKLTIPLQ